MAIKILWAVYWAHRAILTLSIGNTPKNRLKKSLKNIQNLRIN